MTYEITDDKGGRAVGRVLSIADGVAVLDFHGMLVSAYRGSDGKWRTSGARRYEVRISQ